MSTCAEFRSRAEPIWEACFQHPFVRAIGSGTLALPEFQRYLRQDYVFIIEYCRFLSMLQSRAPDLAAMQVLSRLTDGILRYEVELHRALAARFGIAENELAATEPLPTCEAYTHYLLATAATGDFLAGFAALLPCLWGYAEIGQRLAAAGTPAVPHYAEWIRAYADPAYQEVSEWAKGGFDDWTRDAGAAARERLYVPFRQASRWELRFWEMAWRGESW